MSRDGRPQNPRPRVQPRTGPPVAAMKVPPGFYHGKWETRQPHGSNPRGPLRGGPARSVNDPRRNPRGGQCGGPERSAKEPQTPSQTSQAKTNGERKKGQAKKGRPTVVTIDENGCERKWGPLSQTSAWRAGSYWEDMDGDARVFLEKDGERKEMEVEIILKRGRPKFTFKENQKALTAARRE